MDVFDVHRRLVADYESFTSSLVQVRDARIEAHLRGEREEGTRWPEPWLSLNPSFAPGGTITDAVRDDLLHPTCDRIFRVKKHADDSGERSLDLYRHQRQAIETAATGHSYVVTTGTGSGKSLTYLIPIVDSILRDPAPGTVKAIVVYPMNALANSQREELEKFLDYGFVRDRRPVTYARYTGQEDLERRQRILATKPDILLTNYVMLEYLLTRPEERRRLIGAAAGLRFLVLDELHTYRGRQGADVAMLVRRVRDACHAPDLQCVGTSATMASGGMDSAREEISRVASRLFGTDVRAPDVIDETLRRATPDRTDDVAALRTAIDDALAGKPRTYEDLRADPLACWIETTFGLATDEETGRPRRRTPTTVAAAAGDLSLTIGHAEPACRDAIHAMLQAGAHVTDPATARPLFAFRLHQFLSKGDTVYVSLEPESDRHITSQYQVSVPGDRDKILLPLAFCRECGQEYHVVARARSGGVTRYTPRQEQDAGGGDAANGYLYVSGAHPWPADPVTDGRLPDDWLDPDGEILPRLRDHLPGRVWVGPDGTECAPGEGILAAYVPSPFRFCLRCRVSYAQVRGSDFAKLATFGAEGRSSAVSLISSSVVRSLRGEPDVDEQARKLLTFVDNRQDASLQAGHFNDFTQVTQVRGAVHRALAATGGAGLTHEELAERVTAALALPVTAYAQNPAVKRTQLELTQRALRRVIAYRVYSDLERGWRVTMPNLEQTGLLRFDYVDLAELAADDDDWANAHYALRDADPRLREELARIVLDEMRRALAIDVDLFTQDGFDRLQAESDQRLDGPWALGRDERLVRVATVYAEPGRKGRARTDVHFTGRSALGRYLRRPGVFPLVHERLGVDDAQAIILSLLHVLKDADLVTEIAGERRGAPGYRLRSSALIWLPGDGRTGTPDPLRKTVDPDVGLRVNTFFRDLYTTTADQLAGLVAAEHTAQVRAEVREEREKEFRAGTLPLLYCSPTMELGVDIATLNAVGMRNVPPTPANYAQRSGRAGRSGSPALVTTYCSTGSPHDQYYFRRSRDMVDGRVSPPRLDLTNEDLLRSHVHAIWLAETGADLGTRMTDVLDVAGEKPSLTVHDHLDVALTDPAAARRAVEHATAVLTDLQEHDEVRLSESAWWHDDWVADTVRGARRAFDEACDPWRTLFRAALADQEEQNKRVLNHATSPKDRERAQARRRQAENQLKLLKNEDSEQQFSDFYTYRYFASEGFLPGYSFPRLPLAAYVPGRRERGTYLQRPRFIAINEFGPGALVYHEGQRYQVTRVQVPTGDETGDVVTSDARTCENCGYWHDRQAGTDTCDECGALLGGVTSGLMRLQTVHTTPRQRISSDEEERRRAGFELRTHYRFSEHGARSGRLPAEVRDDAGNPLAELVYGDTATVRIVNRGRRRRQDRDDIGYWLDPVSGKWLSTAERADATPEDSELARTPDGRLEEARRVAKVVPYVEDRKNVCVLRLARPVTETVAATLRYALERGIETEFQLEDAELTSEPLPDPDGRARMLFIESAEGGAGVLRRLREEKHTLARVAERALEIIHVDPESGDDHGRAPGAPERCERGCYDCLLSYSNQGYHQRIDRLAAVPVLRGLRAAHTVPTGTPALAARNAGADAYDMLNAETESDLERRWLGFIRDHDHRLPDEAQTLVSTALARPDFVYRLPGALVAVFVDGPHHDAAPVVERDLQAEYRLEDDGWLVVRFRHDDDWERIVREYPNVFGPGRGSR